MTAPPKPAPPPADDRQTLAAGTRFGELEIVRTLGIGGFGIVYLARDHSLERDIAIKEFMPAQLAQRGADAHVSVRATSSVKTFEAGRRSFVNEARLLARYDHRSLLKVYRFWEANGTAYMAMPYLQGQTLRRARKQLGHAPDEAWIKKLLLPLLDALALLHAEGVYHRDIAPDNIWISAGTEIPVLLDFGAARREISDRTQSFTAILKPSYAPIEQYAESSAVRQGPWTDVYALGAVLYFLLTGVAPPPATARTLADDCQPLAERDFPPLQAYSKPFLQLIDWALAVRPAERPQSVQEFRAALLGERAPPVRTTPWVQPLRATGNAYAQTELVEQRVGAVGAEQAHSATEVHKQGGDRTVELPRLTGVPPGAARKLRTLPGHVQAPSRKGLLVMGGAGVVAVGLLVALVQVLGGGMVSPADRASLGASAASAVAGVTNAPMQSPMPTAASVPLVAAAPLTVPAPASAGITAVPGQAQAPSGTPQVVPAGPGGVLMTAGAPLPGAAASRPTVPFVRQPSRQTMAAAAVQQNPAEPRLGGAPAPTASQPAAQPPVVDNRSTLCSGRVFLAKDWCFARECEKPANATHPQCVLLRELRESREQREN